MTLARRRRHRGRYPASALPVGAQVRRRAVRPLASALAVSGAALLARPRDVVRLVAPDEAAPWLPVLRVLGGRLVAQYLLVALRPTRPRLLAWAAADAAHALSMVPAAALWPAHRRAAAVSGASSAVSALVALALTGPGTPSAAPPARARRRWSRQPARSGPPRTRR